MTFEYLGLSDEVLSAVKDAGYETPTPIQKQAIPAALQGKDVLGIAQTGTGKTASFTLPMIDILSQGRAKARMPRSLILTPTRELAVQVSESFDKYGKNNKLAQALLIGGVSLEEQVKLLDRGVDVLIATPGRLLDLFDRGKVLLNGVEIMVIDEADRMLDMGFIPDVEKICSLIPQKNQTLFFSATMPPPIEKLVKRFLNDPKKIEIERESTTAETIEQACVFLNKMEKRRGLRALLASEESLQNAIIFCNTKKEVSTIHNSLRRHKFNVGQLHGDMAQAERLDVLNGFKDGSINILVASDVAARGLDIPAVSHVFNFDVPSQSEDYVHRIGRTGRAGRKGKSFTFVERRDNKNFDAVIKMLGQDMKEIILDGLGKGRNNASDNQKDDSTDKDQKKGGQNRSKNQGQNQKHDNRSNTNNNNKPQNKPYKKGRYDSQADIGEMNVGMDKIVGMGEHIPDFLKEAVIIQPMNKSDLEDDSIAFEEDDKREKKERPEKKERKQRKPRSRRRGRNKQDDQNKEQSSEDVTNSDDQADLNKSSDKDQSNQKSSNKSAPKEMNIEVDQIEEPTSAEEAVAAAMGAVAVAPEEAKAAEKSSEEKPKRRRRTTKKKDDAAKADADEHAENTEEKPKRRRRTTKKKDDDATADDAEEKPKRRRRTVKKKDDEAPKEEVPAKPEADAE